ncbi:4-azaleucine resistance transporter AzlC [Bacillus thermophilus]|uniref:4-azaleucine resistance transporter AzlC n=1 Tax=Siminovitchia thermophila TaxID=1245522 RepID=A0ABS2R4J0_9BACI|nr:AzlC family ABC transporter permease [Siminovitchia thermophila]MBM7713551.1 4-azaleucine resistance transporter AzlC [Siminovitchia thermophila]
MEKLIKTNDSLHAFFQGVKDCLPTVLGYLSIGFAAGVVEKTAGLSLMEIALMSLLLYAGSAQFIAAGMWVAGAPVLSIILTIFIVNLRYFLLSAALAPHFRHLSAKKNMINGFLLTDETFGVAAYQLAKRNDANYHWMLGLNVTAYVNWLLANLAGGYFGSWIEQPEAFGLDFALPAMFIGLLILQVINRPTISIELIVIAAAVIFTVMASQVVPTGIDVMIGTIIAACIGMVIEKWK